MGKENNLGYEARVKKEFERIGIKVTRTKAKADPWLEEAAKEIDIYVMKFEDGWKKAAKSKLFFRKPLTPNLQLWNS